MVQLGAAVVAAGVLRSVTRAGETGGAALLPVRGELLPVLRPPALHVFLVLPGLVEVPIAGCLDCVSIGFSFLAT